MWKIVFLFVLTYCMLSQGVRGDGENRKLGDDCELLEDCENIKNSICNVDDVCECKDGYLASSDDTTCLRIATKIGDECQIQEQCSSIPQAECKGNMCVVAQAVTNTTSTAKPKEECTEDSQCTSFLIKRVCKNGTCVMALPSIATTVPSLDIFRLGKSCTDDSNCTAEGTACVDKLCKCKDSFVLGENLKTCLPKAKAAGDTCTETGQCVSLGGSICENGKCTQFKKVIQDFGEKISSLLIGSTCQHDNECKHMSHAFCIENVCQCQDNYVTSILSNSCLEKAKKEGDPCTIDKQCEDIKGATCIQQKCVKPGVIATKLGKANAGSTNTISKLALAAILIVKVLSV